MADPDHWTLHARQWCHVGAPLRPCGEDVARMAAAVAEWCARRSRAAPRALLLGVTPEIAAMRWPPHTALTAVDRNPAMIRTVWPGFPRPGEGALCADWTRLPFADAAFDMVLGDGCFTLQAYPDGYRRLLLSIRRVLEVDGLLVMRHFLRPDQAEPTAQVFADLLAGRIGNFHIFKWRLAQSLHGCIEQGVRLADIWDAWLAADIDAAALAAQLDWRVETIRTLEAYRGVQTRYTFPRMDELRALSADVFTESRVELGGYELGERCPTITYHAL